jgi:hypothetical protein
VQYFYVEVSVLNGNLSGTETVQVPWGSVKASFSVFEWNL